MLVMFLDVWPNEEVQQVQVGGGGGQWEKGTKSLHSFWNQAWVSLDLWAGAESCCHTQGLPPAIWLHQRITTTLQHIQVHFGVDFQADFEDVRWHDVALTWNHTKDHNCSRKLCFHPPWARACLFVAIQWLVLAVITLIGRETELYSGASPISLVEHCVTFRHDRRLLSLLGFVHNRPTSRWSATKKRKPVFIKRKWSRLFLGRQFYRSTLYIYIYIYIYINIHANVWGITYKSWNNGVVNQKIYEKWIGVPNPLTNVALYSLSTKLKLPKLSLVEEFEIVKVRLFQMLRDSQNPLVINALLSVITGRQWKAKIAAANTESVLKMKKNNLHSDKWKSRSRPSSTTFVVHGIHN